MDVIYIQNIDALAKAINERNVIEKNKLNFEKEVFEFNKQLNIDSAAANVDMANTMASLVKRFDTIDKAIQVLGQNDTYLKNEIDALNVKVNNVE